MKALDSRAIRGAGREERTPRALPPLSCPPLPLPCGFPTAGFPGLQSARPGQQALGGGREEPSRNSSFSEGQSRNRCACAGRVRGQPPPARASVEPAGVDGAGGRFPRAPLPQSQPRLGATRTVGPQAWASRRHSPSSLQASWPSPPALPPSQPVLDLGGGASLQGEGPWGLFLYCGDCCCGTALGPGACSVETPKAVPH